jgi:hypothetical protein
MIRLEARRVRGCDSLGKATCNDANDARLRDLGVDLDRLEALWTLFQAELHHACLNDIPGLENPTSEVLSAWLCAWLPTR